MNEPSTSYWEVYVDTITSGGAKLQIVFSLVLLLTGAHTLLVESTFYPIHWKVAASVDLFAAGGCLVLALWYRNRDDRGGDG